MFSVTVITPIYNRKKYVAKMIKMLKAHTLSNREIFTAFFTENLFHYRKFKR